MKAPICAVLFFVLGATALQAQGNFQLLVGFEEGMKPEIFALDKDRNKIFHEKSPGKTRFNGKRYWVALVDEDLVYSGKLRYYCARDAHGKWSVPPRLNKRPKEMICNFKPKDVGRGTFIFQGDR